MAQHHAERIAAEDYAHQVAQWKARYPRRKKGFRFVPSATLDTLVKMSGDPTLTRERVAAFIHAPEAATWDTAWRHREWRPSVAG
jgi:hypothetical protein